MELNCLELFMKTLSGININTVIFRKDCSNLELVDNRFRMHLYENYPYGSTLILSSQKIKKNTLVCKTDEFSHTYFFLRIPEEFLSEEDTDFMSIGPFLSRRKSHGEIYQIMQDNALPERLLNDVSARSTTICRPFRTSSCTLPPDCLEQNTILIICLRTVSSFSAAAKYIIQ